MHKKHCEFIPNPDDSNDLLNVYNNDRKGLAVTTFTMEDGTTVGMLMRSGTAEFIYGDIAIGMMGEAQMRVHKLTEGNGYVPIMEPTLALSKFKEFYLENPPTVQLLRENIPDAKTSGWLLMIFNDFEHYADCILSKDLSTAIITWENDDPIDAEKTEVTTLLDAHGRQKNVLMCQFMVLLPMKVAETGSDLIREGIGYECVPGKCILNRFIRLEDHPDLKGTDPTFSWVKKKCADI